MKKAKQIMFILLFICGIVLPVPLWKLMGAGADVQSSDNRVLAERPVFSAGNYSGFARAYEDYFNDHLPFREELIETQAMTDFLLFKNSSDRVIAGKEGWLFYSVKYDGDPMADYDGSKPLSKSELKAIARNCETMDAYMKERGGEFILFIAPNKERVYSEYMPDKYGAPAENDNVTTLVSYIREHTDVKVVYCYEDLMAEKGKTAEPLYYKTDTHWNQYGAYVGSSRLLGELGIKLPQATAVKAGEGSGDLARLLHLSAMFAGADNEYEMEGFKPEGERYDNEGYHSEIRYVNAAGDPRRVYMCRDSFGDAMVDYVGSCFAETKFIYQQDFSLKDVKEFEPDILVYEVVERYLRQAVTEP